MKLIHRGVLAAGIVALGAAPALAQGEVNIYNARHYGTDAQLFDAFTKQTGIKVNVVSGNHDELVQRMVQEGANSPADVFITVDAGRLAVASDKNLLQPIDSQVLKSVVPAHLRHPEGLWYGLAVRARVVVYNPEKLKAEDVDTYAELADPKLKGKLLVRSGTNIYNLGLGGAIIDAYGKDQAEKWAKGIVDNLARPPQGGDTDQIKAVAAGIGDAAVSNTYYLARLAGSSKPEEKAIAEKLKIAFPSLKDRGTHVNISGAGVTRAAKNKENAVKLLEYLVSPEGQRYFADVNFEYPVNPKVEPHPILKGYGAFKQDALNASVYAANSAEVARIMDRVGWK